MTVAQGRPGLLLTPLLEALNLGHCFFFFLPQNATTGNFWSTVTLLGVEEGTLGSSFLDTYITLTLAHVHSALEG